MYARSQLLRQLQAAADIIASEQPSHIITFGGDCLVDQAPIAYLHEKYGESYGVMWVDAHPDISSTSIFPNGNSMVVGNLMGQGDQEFASKVNKKLTKDQFIYRRSASAINMASVFNMSSAGRLYSLQKVSSSSMSSSFPENSQ